MCERFERHDQPDPIVRRDALGALRLNGPRAEQAAHAIARMLCDADPAVRAAAERAMRLLDGQAA